MAGLLYYKTMIEDKKPTEKEVHAGVANTVIAKATEISVDIKPKNWLHKMLMKLRLKPDKIVYKITPAVYGTLMQAVPLLLSMDYVPRPEGDEIGILDWAYNMAAKNGEIMKKVICIGIHNRRGDYPIELEHFVEDNFESADFQNVAYSVVAKLDVLTFSNTIGSIRGLNPLKKNSGDLTENQPSPSEPVEKIARGEQLETLSNIFASATILSSGT